MANEILWDLHIEQGAMVEGLKLLSWLLAFLVFKSFYKVSEYWLQGLFAYPVAGQTRNEHKITLW